jgi:hypothetical protein
MVSDIKRRIRAEGIKEKYVVRIFDSKRDEVIGGEILAIKPWY